jgi:cysteine desulfurase
MELNSIFLQDINLLFNRSINDMILDLDANATYAAGDSLREKLFAEWRKLGNPSSLHRGGQRAKAAVESAREKLRARVGAGTRDQIVFTSGATEANNLVIAALSGGASHIVSSTIEHPCVLLPLKRAAEVGASVSLVNPNSNGEIDSESVLPQITAATKLVSIMAANNETGVINDIEGISGAARSAIGSAVIHSDAAQLVGKLALDFSKLGLDCMTISGHKFGALTGVGALVIREGVDLLPLILGGPQEQKLRGGTENVLGIISIGIAAEEVMEDLAGRERSMREARDAFERELKELVPQIDINGSSVNRLPNTSSVFIEGIRADDLLVALDLEGVLISSGAACSSGKPEPSHVLSAMGQEEDRVKSTIRVSFRGDQAREVGTQAARVISSIVSRMRGLK